MSLPPYAELLGVTLDHAEDGTPVIVMPFGDDVIGRPGFLQGGAISGLLEVAAIAADSDAAFEAAPRCSFAFVDVNLRDGPTGPGIAARIAREHGVKVVFVTANPSQIDCMDQALGYIRKPFSEAAILAAAAAANELPGSADVEFVRTRATG